MHEDKKLFDDLKIFGGIYLIGDGVICYSVAKSPTLMGTLCFLGGLYFIGKGIIDRLGIKLKKPKVKKRSAITVNDKDINELR